MNKTLKFINYTCGAVAIIIIVRYILDISDILLFTTLESNSYMIIAIINCSILVGCTYYNYKKKK